MKILTRTIIAGAFLIAAALPLAAGAQGTSTSASVKAENDRQCANWMAHSQWSGKYNAIGQRVCVCVSGYAAATDRPVCLKVQSNIAVVNGHRVQTFADGSQLDLDTNTVLSNGKNKPVPSIAVPAQKSTVHYVLSGSVAGDPCVHPDHSVCIAPGSRQNLWQCQDDYFEFNGQCYPKAKALVPRLTAGRSGDNKYGGCLKNHGVGTVWNVSDNRCVCKEGFSLAADGVSCEPVDRWCFKKIGTSSYYNSNLNSCVCKAGHAFVGGACQ